MRTFYTLYDKINIRRLIDCLLQVSLVNFACINMAPQALSYQEGINEAYLTTCIHWKYLFHIMLLISLLVFLSLALGLL